MARLDALVIGRVRHHDALAGLGVGGRLRQDRLAFGLGLFEMPQQDFGIGHVKIPPAVFLLGLAEHIAIGQRNRRLRVIIGHVHHMVGAQHIHRQPLKPVGQLARDRGAIKPANLLEIGELAHFHTVTPDLPAQTPGAQCGRFPIILDKADIMHAHVDADGFETAKIEILQIGRAGFDQDLKLIVMLQPVGVFAIAPIGRAARGLHIGRGPRLWPQRAQRGGRVKRACAHFHIIGLQHGAALRGPIGLQPDDDLLKGTGLIGCYGHVSSKVWGEAGSCPLT